MKSLIALLVGMLLATSAFAEEDSFQALRDGGHVLLLRHAIAPGFGDPTGFELDDCATQRNLSAEGREQARAIGERLRAEGLGDAAVYTSEWCRGRETAEEMALTEPQPHPGLNSFFQNREKRDEIVAELRDLLGALANGPPAVLVTHGVSIRAVTGQGVRSGEGVVVRPEADGSVSFIGAFPP
ncbi:histidine phosphatase family protein [Spiribacter vilamensis]|uniref:Histidine phosphatase superfamily protein (Branch 1) n=1 Tax=Spiribacter vilamensis TaxID=531306 RepID=A0A4Q8D088_9GAMM|nr:histidine phosphatase family protein [Spiribacter vilamensis]RZU98731.1 histidine phosphatase superfamily protein (branch 1) [Spiribacter vilamensis]TVO62245.1 histidine phosphatase family protein [Spiribacter vilamensis]